jgi:hypothetical protein
MKSKNFTICHFTLDHLSTDLYIITSLQAKNSSVVILNSEVSELTSLIQYQVRNDARRFQRYKPNR